MKNKVSNKSGLPKGFHLKTKGKIELHLPFNGLHAYYGLFESIDVALFIYNNYHLFAHYNVKRVEKKSLEKYWSVYDRFYSANDIKKALVFGKRFTMINNIKYITSGQDFSEILARKNISINQLSQRWNLSVANIEKEKNTNQINIILSDAISHIKTSVKNISAHTIMSGDTFKSFMIRKGITTEYLAKHWHLTNEQITLLQESSSIPPIYIDAIKFIKYVKENKLPKDNIVKIKDARKGSIITDNRTSEKVELPVGTHLKSNGKYEVNLTINGTFTYIALFSSLEAAVFTSKNYFLLKKYKIKHNGIGKKFWQVNDRNFPVDKIKTAFDYAKKSKIP
jgi:DNA-binding Xre family transcriptional regulator